MRSGLPVRNLLPSSAAASSSGRGSPGVSPAPGPPQPPRGFGRITGRGSRGPPDPAEKKQKGKTETSRDGDGDGSSSEGDARVMDEDIMVESDETSWSRVSCFWGVWSPFGGVLEGYLDHSCAKVKKNNVPDVFYCQTIAAEGPRRATPNTPRSTGDS
uniref:Uncharacterized protein n=1 Tax=Malurus cyaneus samueli TaxID=2593467 RepID=A0A8C5U7E9_9PASS